VQLNDILKEKTPLWFHQFSLFLHDNAPAHRVLATQKILANLGFQCLDHSPYSPDLAPSDYHLFLELKKRLKVRHFSSEAEVVLSVRPGWMQRVMNFFDWFAKVRAMGEDVYCASWCVCVCVLNKFSVWSL
jgi:hypothetical protein